MKTFDAVVFDMDGVIFDSEKLVIECWGEVAQKYKIKDIEAACRECTGMNATATLERFKARYGQDFPYEQYKKEMSELFHHRYGGGRLPLKPGVKEILSFLKECDKKVALASSTRQDIVRQELTDAGIIKYFDEVVCGDMVKRSKPEPDIFIKACECLGVRCEDTFAIEDSYNGIRAASIAGNRAIMVPDLLEPTREMEEQAEVILPSLLHVIEYLKA